MCRKRKRVGGAYQQVKPQQKTGNQSQMKTYVDTREWLGYNEGCLEVYLQRVGHFAPTFSYCCYCCQVFAAGNERQVAEQNETAERF